MPRQLLAAIRPPKPLTEMSAAEREKFVDEVVALIVARRAAR
jgi:hypothetical protein